MRREPLLDGHGRTIDDLRVSVVDRCNFRCQYCMPADGLPWLDRSEILSFEETQRLVGLFAEMGVRALRLTGGEPLVRREFPKLVAMLREIELLEEIAVTTNGYLLERDAEALVRAGVDRFNVSIDSLARDAFFKITRRDALPQVIRGLEAIAAFPEVRPIKVNAIAMRDFTEDEVLRFCELARTSDYQVRFIEFMPLDADRNWEPDAVLTGREIREIDRGRAPARGGPPRAARHGQGLPVRRRRRRDRLHQPGLRALLRRLQPHPPHLGRQAPHLPVLDPRDRSARPAALRGERRGAGAGDPGRRLAQGAQAPRQRARVPPAAADDEPDRRLTRAQPQPRRRRLPGRTAREPGPQTQRAGRFGGDLGHQWLRCGKPDPDAIPDLGHRDDLDGEPVEGRAVRLGARRLQADLPGEDAGGDPALDLVGAADPPAAVQLDLRSTPGSRGVPSRSTRPSPRPRRRKPDAGRADSSAAVPRCTIRPRPSRRSRRRAAPLRRSRA